MSTSVFRMLGDVFRGGKTRTYAERPALEKSAPDSWSIIRSGHTAHVSRIDQERPPIIETQTTLSAGVGSSSKRILVAAPAAANRPLPLIEGTSSFTSPWLREWHLRNPPWPAVDVACHLIENIVVSGAGNIWVDGRLIIASEVMPHYVRHELSVATGGTEGLRNQSRHPLRVIEEPCLVAVGHGLQIYGHFLIELMFRLLVARHAGLTGGAKSKVLLDTSAPSWLLTILHAHFGVTREAIAFYDQSRERVLLKQAIVPSRVLRDEFFHPFTNALVHNFLVDTHTPPKLGSLSRIFLGRRHFFNPAAPPRRCLNEERLSNFAVKEFGFEEVFLETLSWTDQIALFKSADIIMGCAGSGMHNTIFSKRGTRVASIGHLNLVQSQLGALCGHHNAYLTDGFSSDGDFVVDEENFKAFAKQVCH